MKKIISVLLCVIVLCSIGITALSDAATYDMNPAGYHVYVMTPDGGLNLRYGPGTDYGKVMEGTIPDYTRLYIQYVSGNWGYTEYNGYTGWVALKQTTTIPPEPVTPPKAEEAPITEESPDVEKEQPVIAEEPTTASDASQIPANDNVPVNNRVNSVVIYQIALVGVIILLICAIAVIGILLANKKSK